MSDNNNIHWSSKRAKSFGCSFNMIIGPRGPGKTFEMTRYVIDRFIKTGDQFLWVRRYPKEIRAMKTGFFDDMKKYEIFPGHELTMKGTTCLVDGKLAGKIIALSTGDDQKSTPTPNVNTIVFDEFILEPGYRHYLPNEVRTFLNLVNSTVRMRSGWSVWMLANAVTISNPYFEYWNVHIPRGKDIARVTPEILVEYVRNVEFENAAAQSQFGRAVAGTEYADYAIKNEFILDNDTFLAKKSPNAQYYFTIRFNSKEYGIYADFETGHLFVSLDADPSFPVRFALTDDDHRPNTLIVKGRKNLYISNLLNCYAAGSLFFESQKIKGAMRRALAMLH